MKKQAFSILFLVVAAVFFLKCDSTNSPDSLLSEEPIITSLSVSPALIEFDREIDGFRDTTVTFELVTEIVTEIENFQPTYAILDASTRDGLVEGVLTANGNEYSVQAELNINTTTILDLVIVVYALNGNGNGTTAETYAGIKGFAGSAPVIEEVTSPGTINRPDTGAIPATFTATVTDLDGNDTIDEVTLRIIDLETEEIVEIQMSDDGTNRGDLVANDQIYTTQFDITPTNNRPERSYNIEFFAIDLAGLLSDTVSTTFTITDN
ncbi:MAG: hypothetical protein MI700_05305 [Balneolales bacterium]|nr:hypothetical protein [Balneolales bacterium]